MAKSEELEARIISLPPADRARLRDCHLLVDDADWDAQIARDSRSRRFEDLIGRARRELAEGKAGEL